MVSRLTCLSIAGLLFAITAPLGWTAEIAALFSSDIEPYAMAYEGFAEGCPANYWKYDLSQAGDRQKHLLAEVLRKRPDLILAIGSRALKAARDATSDVPIVFVMVLDHAARNRPNVAGVSIRVDPTEELKHFRLIFPEVGRVGFVYDPANSSHFLDHAKRAAEENGIVLVTREATDVVGTLNAIREIEGDVDGWWLNPDPSTLTNESVEYVLMHSIRKGLPVLAPSKRYVDRGAQVALVPDYREIGRAGAEIAKPILRGVSPSSIGTQFAEKFRVVVNGRTCRKLGADLTGSWMSNAEMVGRREGTMESRVERSRSER